MPPRTDGERITALEVNHTNLTDDVKEIKQKVDEMHALLLQAKGAKIAVYASMMGLSGLSGYFASHFHKIWPFGS